MPSQPNSDVDLIASRTTHMAGWGKSSKSVENTLRKITLTTLHQNHCNTKYDLSGNSGDAQDRQKFLPKMFTEAVFCAGSVVSIIFHVIFFYF